MPVTDTIDLVRLASAAEREQFVPRAPRYTLVGPHPASVDIDFHTNDMPFQGSKPLPRDFQLFAILKGAGNPYAERISVGRARNCDVAIRHKSVSKLHAHFRVEEKRLLLIDNNSRNGTRVDGRVLTPELREQVAAGSRVVFGSIEMLLLDAAGLFDFLRDPASTPHH